MDSIAEPEIKTVHFNCPICDQSYEAPESQLGKAIVCTNCERGFIPPRPGMTGEAFKKPLHIEPSEQIQVPESESSIWWNTFGVFFIFGGGITAIVGCNFASSYMGVENIGLLVNKLAIIISGIGVSLLGGLFLIIAKLCEAREEILRRERISKLNQRITQAETTLGSATR